jgi:nucleoside-diphosphate-sugar epimerase
LSKLLAERLVKGGGFARSLAIRCPGILGPGSVRNWLSESLRKAKRGEDIRIFNADAPYNNAVHVDDLTDLVVRLLKGGWSGQHAGPVGAGGASTARHVMQAILAGCGSRSRLIEAPAPQAPYLIDFSLAERFGYAPRPIGALIERFIAENATDCA